MQSSTKLIDLQQVCTGSASVFCLRNRDLFQADDLEQRYRAMDNRRKLRVIELMTRPNGYLMIGGQTDSWHTFDERIQTSRISL